MTHTLVFTSQRLDEIMLSVGKVQVQLRCFRLDGTGYINRWPDRGSVIFNDTNIMEFKHPEECPNRSDNPLNITTLILPGKNTISVLKY